MNRRPKVACVDGVAIEVGPSTRDRLPVRFRSAASQKVTAEQLCSLSAHIEQVLLDRGVVILEDLAFNDVGSFTAIAECLIDELFADNTEHPLAESGATVYRPTAYPESVPVLWHNENAHLAQWPAKILFGCLRPASKGGWTMVTDCAAVYEVIPAGLRRVFERRGLRYQRICGGGLGLGWRTAFQTDSRKDAEQKCRAAGYEFSWLDEDRLRLRWTRPATLKHPTCDRWLWFNQLTHFHPAFLPADTRSMLNSICCPEELPRDCRFGDNGPIDDDIALQIGEAYRQCEQGEAWLPGRALLIDNMRCAHARTPFSGPRELLVALGDMIVA